MFEVNKEVDITVVSDIGPESRTAVIIDNFYKNPDYIRETAYTLPLKNHPDLIAGLPGWRIFEEEFRVRKNLRPILENLKNQPIWKYEVNQEHWDTNWNKTEFMCNVMNSECRAPGGGVPHEDGFDINFGAVIYLNTPEECNGGTRLYSLDGRQSVRDIENTHGFRHNNNDRLDKRWKLDPNGDGWNVELELEMVYNRCIFYEADMFHAQWYDEDAFKDFYRIAQVLFV